MWFVLQDYRLQTDAALQWNYDYAYTVLTEREIIFTVDIKEADFKLALNVIDLQQFYMHINVQKFFQENSRMKIYVQ